MCLCVKCYAMRWGRGFICRAALTVEEQVVEGTGLLSAQNGRSSDLSLFESSLGSTEETCS